MSLPMSKDEKKIRTYLSDMGVRYDLAGYTYLVEIIEYILTTPTLKTKKAIDSVGQKYGVSLKNVQNSIRYCLRNTERGDLKMDAKQVIFDCVMYVRESEAQL